MQLLTPEFGLLFWTLFSLFIVILPLLALVDILRSRFEENSDKIIWVVIVLFIPCIGALLYFFIGRKQKVKLNQL